MIGTTQFVNAFVQRAGYEPVAIFRVSLPKADGVPPMATWPDDLVRAIGHDQYMVGGGSLFTGKDYAPLDEDALRQAATDARDKGIRAVAISANFSPIRPDLEERAAAIVSRIMPEARITLSHKVGGLGLVERENSAIINAALGQLASKVISSLKQAFADLAIRAPLFVCQNDGTLIPTEMAEALPDPHLLGRPHQQCSRRRPSSRAR